MFICCLSYDASVTYTFVALVSIMNLGSSKMFSAIRYVGELNTKYKNILTAI